MVKGGKINGKTDVSGIFQKEGENMYHPYFKKNRCIDHQCTYSTKKSVKTPKYAENIFTNINIQSQVKNGRKYKEGLTQL